MYTLVACDVLQLSSRIGAGGESDRNGLGEVNEGNTEISRGISMVFS